MLCRVAASKYPKRGGGTGNVKTNGQYIFSKDFLRVGRLGLILELDRYPLKILYRRNTVLKLTTPTPEKKSSDCATDRMDKHVIEVIGYTYNKPTLHIVISYHNNKRDPTNQPLLPRDAL